MPLDKATSTVIKSIYASQIFPSGAQNNYLLKYSSSAESWIPSNVVTALSVSAAALSGSHFGDGSKLTGVQASGGFATDVTKLPLAGGTLTGTVTGPNATFTRITGTHYGDGSNLTGVRASGGTATDPTKLPIEGGTLTGPLVGTTANFTSVTAPVITGTHYGDGSNLTGIVATGGSAVDNSKLPLVGGTLTGPVRGTTATFSETVSAPAVRAGYFYGDGRYLTGISLNDPTPLPTGNDGQILTFDGPTGTWVAKDNKGGAAASLTTNILTGNGTSTYALTNYTNQSVTNYMAFIGGVAQRPGIDFGMQGRNIVFQAPVATGTEIIVYSLINIAALSGLELLPAGTNGQVLVYNGATNTWVASAAPVTLPAGTGGQVLTYNGSTNTWVASAVPNEGVPVGTVAFFAAKTPPAGYLECDGSVVSAALYSDLTTAIYCGNANNNTASFGYRCTNASSPSTSRSTTGNFIVLPDLRGEFIRGWDSSNLIDPNRSFGSKQSDEFRSHTHGPMLIENFSYIGYNGNTDRGGGANNSRIGSLPETGGTETRPRNVALLPCIKAFNANLTQTAVDVGALAATKADKNTIIGDSQTYQDVTASRSKDTTYTNTTTKPILVCVSGGVSTGPSVSMIYKVNGIIIGDGAGDSNNGGANYPFSFIVPVGSTYRVEGTRNIGRWVELR